MNTALGKFFQYIDFIYRGVIFVYYVNNKYISPSGEESLSAEEVAVNAALLDWAMIEVQSVKDESSASEFVFKGSMQGSNLVTFIRLSQLIVWSTSHDNGFIMRNGVACQYLLVPLIVQ